MKTHLRSSLRLLHILVALAMVVPLLPGTLAPAVAGASPAVSQPNASVILTPTLDLLKSTLPVAPQTAEPELLDPGEPLAIPIPVLPAAADDPQPPVQPTPTVVPTPITDADDAIIGPAGGALRSLDGRITIDVPASAVRTATRFRYQAAEMAEDQGRSFLAPWIMRLTAEDAATAAPITHFEQPLTLHTQLPERLLAETSWHPRRLSFYYYAPEIGAWVALAGQTDGQGGIAALTTHFTDFGVGKGPEDKIIPSVQGFTVDAFSGAASLSLPIEVPPGRNGLQPSLSLSYSSGSVDDMYNSDRNWLSTSNTTISGGPHNGQQVGTGYHKQAPWTGLGWNLSGLPSMTRDISTTNEYQADDSFYLNLGGSFKLLYASGWKTDPDAHVRIDRYGSECDGSNGSQNPDCRWKVTTADGTQHLFTVGTTYVYANTNCNEFTRTWVPSSWNISVITDTHGNTMSFTYDIVDNTETPVCAQQMPSHAWSYPATITYPQANGAVIEFQTSTRSDDVDWGAGQNGNKKLDAIVVKHNNNQVRKYTLTYDYGHAYRVYAGFPGRLVLTKVTQSDTNDATALPPTELAYVSCQNPNGCPDEDGEWKRDYVQVVHNGWGGRVEYAYDNRIWPSYHRDGDSQTYPCTKEAPCAGQSTRLRVTSRMWFGGLGGFFREVFTYGDPLAQVTWRDASNQFHGYEFLGHSWTQVTTETANGTGSTEKAIKQYFYQYPKPGAYKADPRKGKVYKTETSGPGLATAAVKETEAALTTDGNGVNQIYTKAVTDTLGAKSAVITYTVDTYGNVTGEYYQGDTAVAGDEKTILKSYFTNTTDWLVNRIRAQNTFTGTNPDTTNWTNLAANQRFAYDGEQPANCAAGSTAPTQGDLAQTCTWLSGPITSSPTHARIRYSYDQWGNQTQVTDAKDTPGQTYTKYDDTYHTFPVIITQTVSASAVLTQAQTVDNATGKPLSVWDANGSKTDFAYDTFTRLSKVIAPGDNTDQPTLAYGYANIPSPFVRNGNMERPGDWAVAAGNVTASFVTTTKLIGDRSLKITNPAGGSGVVQHASTTAPQASKSYVVSAKIWRPDNGPTVQLRVYDGTGTFLVDTAESSNTWEWVRGIITTSATVNAFYVQVSVGSAAGDIYVDDVQASAPYAVRTDKRETSGTANTLYSRSVYNGLGQIAQTQAEYDATQNIFQDFAYAASGWKTSESVPYLGAIPQSNGMPWREPPKDPTQPATQYAYDALGRATTQTNTDNTTVQMAYQDWKTAVVDENQHEKITENDAFGRTKTISETSSTHATPSWTPTVYARTGYTYDILDNLLKVDNTDTTAITYTTSLVYNRASHKTGMTDPDMGAWSYEYDKVGNLITQTNALSQQIIFTYDRINRPLTKIMATGNITYTYDVFDEWWDYTYGRGKRTGMSDQSGGTVWRYDRRGRLTYEEKTITGMGSFVTQYTYDAMDRIVTMTYPDDEQVTTAYNDAGLPKSLTGSAPQPYVGDQTYTAWGAVDLRKLGPSGTPHITVDYSYYGWTTANGRSRVQQITAGSIQDLRYTYDAVGNVLTIQDYKAGTSPSVPQTQTFTYDELNRLVTAKAENGAVSSSNYAEESYVYNFAGNLTSKAGVSYTYGDASHKHAVTHLAGVQKYWYDANGNMTSRIAGSTYTFSYDKENRLTGVSNGATASFTYDGDGQQVKSDYGNGTTITIYIGGYYEKTGSTVKKYYSIGGARVAMRQGTTVSYLLSDHLGSTSITANTSGAKVAELRYKAWGENRYADQTTPTSYHYTGQREESGLGAGMYFYNARWYDAALGRFLQADTIVQEPGNPQALNRYAYTLNNPPRYVDPTGHFTEEELRGWGISDELIALWKNNGAWWTIIREAQLGDTLYALSSYYQEESQYTFSLYVPSYTQNAQLRLEHSSGAMLWPDLVREATYAPSYSLQGKFHGRQYEKVNTHALIGPKGGTSFKPDLGVIMGDITGLGIAKIAATNADLTGTGLAQLSRGSSNALSVVQGAEAAGNGDILKSGLGLVGLVSRASVPAAIATLVLDVYRSFKYVPYWY